MLFGIDQRPPSYLPPPAVSGNNGGWSTERLKGFENTARCDVDMVWASEVDAEYLWRNYVAQTKPVLIRGLINAWPAREVMLHLLFVPLYHSPLCMMAQKKLWWWCVFLLLLSDVSI